jgi:hypothetical protein
MDLVSRLSTLVAFLGFSLGSPVQPVKIAAPYAFAFGALGLQIFLRVRFKGIAAGFIAEPITVPLPHTGSTWVLLAVAVFSMIIPFFSFVLLLYTQEICHFVASKLN